MRTQETGDRRQETEFRRSRASRPLIPDSPLPSPVSRVLSPVSRPLSRVSDLLSPVSCLLTSLFFLLSACSARPAPELAGPIEVLAVLPIERTRVEPQEGALETELEQTDLPADAGFAVTAQVYGWLADQSVLRFVPDVTVSDALLAPSVRDAPNLQARATALGKVVNAQGVIFGTVTRFRERVGTGLGVTRAASVAFDLNLVEVVTGKVVWRGQFNETQQPLSSNLFNFWMFWEAGPQWFTARELAGLGVRRLMEQMERTIRG